MPAAGGIWFGPVDPGGAIVLLAPGGLWLLPPDPGGPTITVDPGPGAMLVSLGPGLGGTIPVMLGPDPFGPPGLDPEEP